MPAVLKVDLYRNLHTGLWSIRHKGRVLMQAENVELKNVEFIVSAAGRARCLREKKRCVHAVARGEIVSLEVVQEQDLPVRVTYNPYVNTEFIDAFSKKGINTRTHAYFTTEGKVTCTED